MHLTLPSYAYSTYWSALELPCGVVTLGVVNHDETNYRDQIEENEADSFNYYAKKAMNQSAGLPIAVQVIGNPNKDDMVLEVMKEL